MPFFMGVDGGNSKTEAVVVDENGQKLGEGRSGCGNHQVRGVTFALNHIREAIEQAANAAHLSFEQIEFVQYALSGADRERDEAILNPALSALPLSRWALAGDAMAGLRTACPDCVGVVLVCGAGTNALGRNRYGRVVQTGGFGYLYGDSAGGRDMARETFRAAVRSYERREEDSLLAARVPQFLGFDNMQRLLTEYLDKGIQEVPLDLTVVLHQAAQDGDKLAIRMLEYFGRELGTAANSVIARMEPKFDVSPIRVALVGSVFQKGQSKHLLNALQHTMLGEGPENPQVELVIPNILPVYGSVLLAMDHLGMVPNQAMLELFAAYSKG
ncbi:ATPase [Alicyclobacillus tolerans]|uniref:N-acetylglucosamine kinase n=1 Tax=Alicyclobacillus tolerans TaxID=90970 RepID=UPI001F19FB0C|nr:BadF/BadG/BcrA/BcrD ATPase family protein [Alicyclobacillus tolerans]MCF8563214.1 ATPase [Alicyclobacillus tolerans]